MQNNTTKENDCPYEKICKYSSDCNNFELYALGISNCYRHDCLDTILITECSNLERMTLLFKIKKNS